MKGRGSPSGLTRSSEVDPISRTRFRGSIFARQPTVSEG